MDAAQQFLPLLGQDDPLSAATAALEARRRHQVTDAGYPRAAEDAGNPYQAFVSMLGPSLVERAIAQRDAMRAGNWQPDPMGDATAQLEARRRQQVQGAGYDPDKGLYDRYSEMLGTALGPTIAERARAAADAMRRGDMAAYQKLAGDLSMDFGGFLGSIKGVRNPIRAYHGSPHDFDRFSMDKIGTGEGGQAYGHGLYFAENEGVARSYRNTLSPPPEYYTMPDGHKITMRDVYNSFDRDDLASTRALKAGEITRDWDKAEKYLRYRGDEAALEKLPFIKQYIDLASIDPPSGRMYEVNIHADPERFLDLDKPLSQQAQAVRDAAMRAITQGAADAARAAGISGADVAAGVANSAKPIGMFSNAVKGPVMSDAMRSAGIPGVRYFDAMSRKPGDGTRNYVVFDDKLIEILRKYGLLPPLAAGGAAALTPDEAEAAAP